MSLSCSVLNENSSLGQKAGMAEDFFSPSSSHFCTSMMHQFYRSLSTEDLITVLSCTQHPFSVPVEIVSLPSELIEEI